MLAVTHLIEFMIPQWIASCPLKIISVDKTVNQSPSPRVPDRSENTFRDASPPQSVQPLETGNHMVLPSTMGLRAPPLPSPPFSSPLPSSSLPPCLAKAFTK